MMEKTTNYDEVCQAALFLSHDDLERLIERLIAERDGTFSGFLPQDGFKRPLGRELAARLNYNVRNNVDVDRRIQPDPKPEPERPKTFEDAFLSRLRQADAQSEADNLMAREQSATPCDDGNNQPALPFDDLGR